MADQLQLPDTAKIVTYDLTLLPRDWEGAYIWHLTVEWRDTAPDGTDLWAVCWGGRCANRRGDWSPERSPSNRTERWLRTHRFGLAEAMKIANRSLPKLTINGLTAADVIARHAATGDTV